VPRKIGVGLLPLDARHLRSGRQHVAQQQLNELRHGAAFSVGAKRENPAFLFGSLPGITDAAVSAVPVLEVT
jgi:hypothetical protein